MLRGTYNLNTVLSDWNSCIARESKMISVIFHRLDDERNVPVHSGFCCVLLGRHDIRCIYLTTQVLYLQLELRR